MTQDQDLRASAKSGLVWGVGFTLSRDLVQFLAMLVMVRLLSPEIYGQQALAQTIIGFLAVASLKTLSQYPLQSRDPKLFDWDAHFSVGAVLNLAIFILTIGVGLILRMLGNSDLATIGLVVIALSPIFIIEIAGTYHLAWLQAHHRWKRMRLLLLVGALAASILGIILALMGWGVFALASTTMFLAVPPALDLLLFPERRPQFALSRLGDYAEGVKFGISRAVSTVAWAGRGLAETSAMGGFFGFAALGSFSRAIGLAQITSGRIGPVAAQTLYSVLTRAEAASERFRRFGALLFQGVTWLSIPTAAFLAVEAHAVVELLYGARWASVVPLLPLAALLVAMRGISATLNQTMLANLQVYECMRIDLASVAGGMVAIALAIPLGVSGYLLALIACEVLTLAAVTYFAARGRAVAVRSLIGILLPCIVATLAAVASVLAIARASPATTDSWASLVLPLAAHAAAFGATYLTVLYICAPRAMAAIIDALPLPSAMRHAVSPLFGRPRESGE